MDDSFDSVDKIRFIHGLMKKEVEELIRFLSSSKVDLSETSTPPMDVMINEGDVIIYVELPGLTTEDFTVYQYDDVVVIEGKRPINTIKNARFIRVERESVRFKRVLKLPYCLDGEAKAKLKDGVLEIRIALCACDN